MNSTQQSKDPTNTALRERASFRDPAGQVFRLNDRVLRSVTESGAENYEFVRASGLLERWCSDGQVVGTREVEIGLIGKVELQPRYVLEHSVLPFVSYPYEWCFSALRAAALLQLDLLLEGLDHNVTLSDASAYNVQFRGARPLFIDVLSFCRYRDGDYWIAHRQFCEQLLNPLLLTSSLGIPFNAWLRGAMEGIPTAELNRLLPWFLKLNWPVLNHVVLPTILQNCAERRPASVAGGAVARPLPRQAYRGMIAGLRRWIERLQAPSLRTSTWSGYAETNTYSDAAATAKDRFVRRFAAECRPDLLLDFGCNTGVYAESALAAGAVKVIGFDSDPAAIEAAFGRASSKALDFLPLCLDAANPSPNQGWRGIERQGLAERVRADGLLALAFVHHLAIARNIPLDEIVAWLVGLAPQGVIEFVGKDDPTVQIMLRDRRDIFPHYTAEGFLAAVQDVAEVVEREDLGDGRRFLLWYRRKPEIGRRA